MRSIHWIGEIIVILAAVLCLVAAGCSKIENPAVIPYSNSDFPGMAYEDAVSAIREAGFVNIQEATVKPIIGTPGTVKSVSVNGELSFSKGRTWENNVPVVITYYAEEQAAPEPAEAAAQDDAEDFGAAIEDQGEGPEEPEEKISEADMKAILESAMAAGFGENCSVSLDGVIFTASAWQDGMAMTALLAQGGNAEAAIAWDQVRTSTVAASKSLQEMLNNNGFSDYLATVNILNDANHDNILLCVMAGMIVTDAAA